MKVEGESEEVLYGSEGMWGEMNAVMINWWFRVCVQCSMRMNDSDTRPRSHGCQKGLVDGDGAIRRSVGKW